MIALSENLSKPCKVEPYGGGKSKEALMEAYIDVLGVVGKCELQRQKAFELNQELIELYSN